MENYLSKKITESHAAIMQMIGEDETKSQLVLMVLHNIANSAIDEVRNKMIEACSTSKILTMK